MLEREFLQLNPYYMDTRVLIPPSTQEYLIMLINLLYLLVQIELYNLTQISWKSFHQGHLKIHELSMMWSQRNHSLKFLITMFSILGKQSRMKIMLVSWIFMQNYVRYEISNTTQNKITCIMLEQTMSILTQIPFRLLKNVNQLNTFSDIKL